MVTVSNGSHGVGNAAREPRSNTEKELLNWLKRINTNPNPNHNPQTYYLTEIQLRPFSTDRKFTLISHDGIFDSLSNDRYFCPSLHLGLQFVITVFFY